MERASSQKKAHKGIQKKWESTARGEEKGNRKNESGKGYPTSPSGGEKETRQRSGDRLRANGEKGPRGLAHC